MRSGRRQKGGPWRVAVLMAALVGLQFYARPRVWDGPSAPDFLVIGLLLLAIRSSPGVAALLGLVIGLVADVLTPAHFGAGMLAHTVVGYLAAQGRAVVFADNLLVTTAVFGVGLWLRNAIMLVASATGRADLVPALAIWSPLQALTTALAGVVIVILFRDWLAIRIVE